MSSLKIGEMGIIFQQMVLGLDIHMQNNKFGLLHHTTYKNYTKKDQNIGISMHDLGLGNFFNTKAQTTQEK